MEASSQRSQTSLLGLQREEKEVKENEKSKCLIKIPVGVGRKNRGKIQFEKIIAEIFFFFLQCTHFHIQDILLKICCNFEGEEFVPQKNVWHFHLLSL